MKQFIYIFLPAILCVFSSCSKDNLMGEIAGSIYFAGTRVPVQGAQVSLDNEISITDEVGNYLIRQRIGKYYLNAAKEGFDTFTEDIRIIHGKISKDIEMTSTLFTSLVHGKVMGNHTGAPQSGIQVMMLNPDDTESQLLDFSDSDGNFILQNIPHGERMIVAILDGVIIFQELLMLNQELYQLNIFLPEPFTFVDPRDGNIYWALKIGAQTWMIENLAWLPEISGPKNGSYTDPYFYVLDYFGSSVSEAKNSSGYQDFGVLYNWSAAKNSCPDGWHLPSDLDWQILELYLGLGLFDTFSDGARLHGEIGRKLKSATGWINNGNGDNSSKFNVLPVGSRFDSGGFDEFGLRAAFWTSTGSSDVFAWGRSFAGNVNWIDRDRFDRSNGLSVRCVLDSF